MPFTGMLCYYGTIKVHTRTAAATVRARVFAIIRLIDDEKPLPYINAGHWPLHSM
jgi:hypothetical protein